MARRLVARWGVVATALAGLAAACGDEGPAPRKTPTPVGDAGHGGVAGACSDTCAGQPPLAGGGAGGAPVGGAAAASGGEAAEAGAPAVTPTLSLSALSIAQSIQLPLMEGGAAVPQAMRSAPVVAGKGALVRAFVELEEGFQSRPLLGVLDVKTGSRSQAFVSELAPSKSSTQDDLGSTFTFQLGGEALEAGSTYRVRVLETDTTPIAAFPEQGYVELGARRLEPFELVLVPMTINGFAPRVSELEVTAVTKRLQALFPSPRVEVTVGQSLVLEDALDAEGAGWDEALSALLDRRAEHGPRDHVFFYGLMAPAANYHDFCRDGCVLGLSNVAEPDAVYERGSIGLAVFQDGTGSRDAWDTLAHELGHALGREHADCGEPDYPDPYYPYDDGGLGQNYGFDLETLRLLKPRQYRDVMSYCVPVWVSDYTYSGLFGRLSAIDAEAFRVLSWSPPVSYRVARIDRWGQSSWRGLKSAPRFAAQPTALPLLDGSGKQVGSVPARVTRLDHLPGGSVWLEARALALPDARAVDLRPAGGGVLAL